MKKILLLVVLALGIQTANAQCPFTFTVSGNTATFTPQPFATIYVVDSLIYDYGDGTTANIPIAQTSNTHTYVNSGTYNVCHTWYMHQLGSSTVITCNFCTSVTIQGTSSNCFVTGGFTYTNSGQTVNFTNTTACTICTSLTTYWDYGDGNNSTVWQGSHTYANPGTYTVCQYETGTNPNNVTCIDTTCQVITVGQTPPGGCLANASFTANVTFPAVAFTNTSTCSGCTSTSYNWDFGDANTSTATSPNHTYASPGSYTVCLYMTGIDSMNNTCYDTTCSTVNVLPNAGGCTVTPAFTEVITGLNVNFTNASSISGGTITNTAWNFGDGGISTASSPSHSYAAAGPYTVTLVVSGYDSLQNLCVDSTSKTITVGPSAINNVPSIAKLDIHPNPTSKSFNIVIPKGEKFETMTLTDVAGRKVAENYSFMKNNIITVSLENRASGIYFIKLQTNRQLYTSSIMKQE